MDSRKVIFSRTSTPEKNKDRLKINTDGIQKKSYKLFEKHLEETLIMFRFVDLNTSKPKLICEDIKTEPHLFKDLNILQ